VVAQPFDRGACPTVPGEVDESLGEFWANPWDIQTKHNLSMFEKNQCFLNVDGQNFVNISYLSGTDSDGDGRAAIALDYNHDGRLDLLVRQVSGEPLRLFENRFPQQHYLCVTLDGTISNRAGIGAKATVEVQGRRIARQLFPVSGLASQEASLFHFGLGDAEEVERLSIRWPSGQVQEFERLGADRHIRIIDGDPELQVVRPGRVESPRTVK